MSLNLTCSKCGSDDIGTTYHKQGCGKASCSCATCSYGSHAKSHDEHLHRFCRGCGFDWLDAVLSPDPEKAQSA